MSALLRVAAFVSVCSGAALAQNPAVDQPHRRAAIVGDADTAGDAAVVEQLIANGFARLVAGQAWDAWRQFRDAADRAPDRALAHLGRALAARAQPRRAVEFAWDAYRARDAATPDARALVDAYARYFGAEARPDRTDPRHDAPPPDARHAALLAALAELAPEVELAGRLLSLERADPNAGPAEHDDVRRALQEHIAWLDRERAMPFVLPCFARDLTAALQAGRLTPAGQHILDRLPRHPHFPPADGEIAPERRPPATADPGATDLTAVTWRPPTAPGFDLARGLGGRRALDTYAGKPALVVFFLGFGCVHCIEQLHALQPRADAFRDAGIEIVTIGTDSADQVKASFQMAVENGDEPLPFEILCDPTGDSFRAWHAWDEFDDEALHGTFLVDPGGRILWQDVSIEPFMDVAFLLAESERLLDAWR